LFITRETILRFAPQEDFHLKNPKPNPQTRSGPRQAATSYSYNEAMIDARRFMLEMQCNAY
jgi:hypothetical protein